MFEATLPAVSLVKPYGYKSEHPARDREHGVNWASTLIHNRKKLLAQYAASTRSCC